MKNRVLTVLVIVLGVALGAIVFMSDRSISRFMERCGAYISDAFSL
jgi:hypothetical protein